MVIGHLDMYLPVSNDDEVKLEERDDPLEEVGLFSDVVGSEMGRNMLIKHESSEGLEDVKEEDEEDVTVKAETAGSGNLGGVG
jgi:hypothetical protein